MKVGIIGGGPLAIEMSLQLNILGAEVSLFSPSLGGKTRFFGEEESSLLESTLKMTGSWEKITTSEGRKILLEQTNKANNPFEGLNVIPTVSEYWLKYLKPLSQFIQSKGIHNKSTVVRVHKRFLDLDEEIEGKTRLFDLFRIVYLTPPDEMSFSEQSLDKKTIESLGEEVIKSLKNPMEKFEDFDIVIDASGVLGKPKKMGPSSSYALNEENHSLKEKVLYGIENFRNFLKIKEGIKRLTIVGSGETAGKILLNFKDQLEKDSIQISIVTSEKNAFQSFLDEAGEGPFSNELENFLKERQSSFETKCDLFEKDLRKWRDLEDYMKAKIKRPQEPSKNPTLYCGFNVTAIDKLIDRQEVFVTIEDAPFRRNSNSIKTIPCDRVAVATGYEANTQLSKGLKVDFTLSQKQTLSPNGLHLQEPGFYTLGPINNSKAEEKGYSTCQRYKLHEGLQQIKIIIDNILSFFTKVGDK